MSIEYYAAFENYISMTHNFARCFVKNKATYNMDKLAEFLGLSFIEQKIDDKRILFEMKKPILSFDSRQKIIFLDSSKIPENDLLEKNINYMKAYGLAQFILQREKKQNKDFHFEYQDLKKDAGNPESLSCLLARNIVLPVQLLNAVNKKDNYHQYLQDTYAIHSSIIKRQEKEFNHLQKLQKELTRSYQNHRRNQNQDDDGELSLAAAFIVDVAATAVAMHL